MKLTKLYEIKKNEVYICQEKANTSNEALENLLRISNEKKEDLEVIFIRDLTKQEIEEDEQDEFMRIVSLMEIDEDWPYDNAWEFDRACAQYALGQGRY